MLKISVSDLKESNLFLNDLYQNVTSAILLADSDARIYNFNDAFRTLFYKQEDQLLKELCGNAMGCVFSVEEQRREIERYNEVLLSILNNRVKEYSHLREQLSSETASSDVMRQELQHRMGNSLQLITSLVSLHSRDSKNGDSERQFVKIIESIQIIKLMYNNIINETGSVLKVNLKSYINSIVSSLKAPEGLVFGHIDFRQDVKALQLGIDSALPLGMILYEVLSNAVVPPGESSEKGSVLIQLNKTGKSQCTLSVSDDGRAISTRRFQQSGLGLELVYILCGQIHGHCRIETGGTIQIIFESSAAAEQCA